MVIFFGNIGNFQWDKNPISGGKNPSIDVILKFTFQVGDLMMNRILFSLLGFQIKVIQF